MASDYEAGFSYQQLALLAQQVLAHTPEHQHFVEGTKFTWVLFAPRREGDAFPKFTQLVRDQLAKTYTVYAAESDIPKEFIWNDGVATSYRNGFAFSARLRKLGSDRVEIEYADYEGSLAAGHRIVEYTWSAEGWRQTAVRDDWVS